MEDLKPISIAPAAQGKGAIKHPISGGSLPVRENSISFNRKELDLILSLYGRRVAAGEWRDYAMDFLREVAVFSVYRKASEVPLYRIEKRPKLARRQGAYAIVSATGLILKRGQDLKQVLKVLEKKNLKLVP